MEFPLGGVYPTLVHQDRDADELLGFVDLHTHPMAHLGFGGQLIYGAVDGPIQDALGYCGHVHGDPFQGGNVFRQMVIGKLEGTDAPPWDHRPEGAPGFGSWPRWHDRTHQHMWVDWIRRAWQGGLRSIVALAVNSHMLAAAGQCDGGPYDDKTVGTKQIEATRDFIGRHSDFMELADSSAKFRDIVRRGKLAVILGVELDCIGNFYNPPNQNHAGEVFNPQPTPQQIVAELDRLYTLGVRYIFPVHVTDNIFGGAAVYGRAFDAATRYTFGSHYRVEPAPVKSQIGFDFNEHSWLDNAMFAVAAAGALGGFNPNSDMPDPVPTTTGHRNSRGLTPLGEVLITVAMYRGMIIDIDHMSERAVERVLQIAEERRYPLLAGHASLRHPGGSEREHTAETLQRIYALWGLWGIGGARGLDAIASLSRELDSVVPQSAYGLGTDACGLEQQPRPRHELSPTVDALIRRDNGMVVYRDNPNATSDSLLRCTTGTRSWDYAFEGCAHYGLLPDMLEEATLANLVDGPSLDRLFRSAEALAIAWQRCEYPYHGMDGVVVSTDGRVWHGVRRDTGWSGFGDVGQAAGGLGPVREVAVAEAPNGELTAVTALQDGTLHMAVRHDSGWTPFNAFGAIPSTPKQPESVVHVACAYEPAGRLHVLAVSSRPDRFGPQRVVPTGIRTGLYHGFMKGSAWTGFGDVRAAAGGLIAGAEIRAAACAFEPGGRLHAVVLASTGLLHSYRLDSGWLPFADVTAASATDFLGHTPVGVACAYEPGGRLHLVVVTNDGGLWHGYRLDTGWTRLTPVDLQAGGARVRQAACSYEPGGRLNVAVTTTDNRLLHGYRHATDWTAFGDVLANSPTGRVADVAMAACG